MKRLQFTAIILKPSVSSALWTVIFSILILLTAAWSDSTSTGLIYEFLLGPNSSAQLIESSNSTLEALQEAAFGNNVINNVMLFAFWMVIGIGVYLMLMGLTSSYSTADRIIHELHYINHRKQMSEKDFTTRALIRIFVGFIWLIYVVFFFKIIVPFMALCVIVGTNVLPNEAIGLWYLIIGFAISVISLHLHIVMLRLFLLRPRVINGWDDLLIEEEHASGEGHVPGGVPIVPVYKHDQYGKESIWQNLADKIRKSASK
jgi:hypothetical protein